MLSKKYYWLIARVIRDNTEVIQTGDRINDIKQVINVDGLIHSLCYEFKQDNNRFNSQRFIEACGAWDND